MSQLEELYKAGWTITSGRSHFSSSKSARLAYEAEIAEIEEIGKED